MSDRLPSELGGLPAGTPARPATPYQYPAVHDMPPPRSTAPMSDEDQVKLEKELQTARDRQEAEEAQQAQEAQKAQAGEKGQAPKAPKEPQAAQAGAAKSAEPVTGKKPARVTKKRLSKPIVVPPAGVKTNP